MSVVKDGIDHISNNKKSELDMNVLAMMYKVGLAVKKMKRNTRHYYPKIMIWRINGLMIIFITKIFGHYN